MNPDTLTRNSANAECEEIKRMVCEHFGITTRIIESKTRPEWIVSIRFIAFALCRDSGHTFQTIGTVFKRDHGAVINGCRSIETFKHHPNVKKALADLRAQLAQQTTKEVK